MAIKRHTLAHLDLYLEAFESAVLAAGGEVHWARDDAEARRIVLDICRAANARTVTKGKTMVGEEIGLNAFLEAHGVTPVETDLGEYIVQLAGEPPSPHHRPGDPQEPGPGGRPLQREPRRSRGALGRRYRKGCWPTPARSCAAPSSPPMSG